MQYTIQDIQSIIGAKGIIVDNTIIEYLIIDSRKIIFPNNSLFFALHSDRRDGHSFIEEAYQRGIRNFIVEKSIDFNKFPNTNFLLVHNSLNALQTLAAKHRSQFQYPVIGITGSNGKTIVKEWLNQLLCDDYTIVRSPRSYNSQIGVPLSVWQMNENHSLAIFEAGISKMGEMNGLLKIIQPTIGILTNIGEAHSEGFTNDSEKLLEKIELFSTAELIIYNKEIISDESSLPTAARKISWSKKTDATVFIKKIIKKITSTNIEIHYQQQNLTIDIPFTDEASIENCITCICTLLALNISWESITERMQLLQPVAMRLQINKGLNNCSILNDSYNNDVSSLSIVIDYLKQQSGNATTTVILSDILQSGIEEEQLYQQVAAELKQRKIGKLIGIGNNISKYHSIFNEAVTKTIFYTSTQEFLKHSLHHHFKDEFILLKGARIFTFEKISRWLEQKVHQTVMEINLSAMAHNLKAFQQKLLPTTKLMAMVKAFSYGSGSAEVARLLQFHKVDYLGVAYADEGIELRNAGISTPIMVMNMDAASFDVLIEHQLEPEIYSLNIFKAFHQYLSQQGIYQFPIHIKLNTGMNRLGFDLNEVQELASLLKQQQTMVVQSVFSHLTSSELAAHDYFTNQQTEIFLNGCHTLEKTLGYSFIKHIVNSAGIFRHYNLQFDMVRLGIGLYGVDNANGKEIHLETVATLKTTIAQIRTVKSTDTVGYNKKGVLSRDSKIATIRIGYADGFNRKLSNGIGSVVVKNKMAKVIGNVCMDMTMIDVTDIADVQEGDEVEIFGNQISVQQVAEWCDTIPYEIMTTISQRVKRVYIEE